MPPCQSDSHLPQRPINNTHTHKTQTFGLCWSHQQINKYKCSAIIYSSYIFFFLLRKITNCVIQQSKCESKCESEILLAVAVAARFRNPPPLVCFMFSSSIFYMLYSAKTKHINIVMYITKLNPQRVVMTEISYNYKVWGLKIIWKKSILFTKLHLFDINRNTVKAVILLQFKITFLFKYIKKMVIYSMSCQSWIFSKD